MTELVREDDVAIAIMAVNGGAAIGRVVEAGERATGLLDRTVLVGPIDPCGECEVCRRGGAPVCPRARHRGALTARVVAAARWVLPLGDGLELPSPAAAAVAGDVAIAYTLYARTGAPPREPLVVVGATPVTRFLVEILRAKGLAPIVVADPAAVAWRSWLERTGAIAVGATSATEARPAILEAVASQGLGEKPWRVIATSAESAQLAAALVGPRATLTVLAPIGPLPGELATREVLVIGVAGAHPDLVVEAAAMCSKGEIDLLAGTSAAPTDDLRAVVTTR